MFCKHCGEENKENNRFCSNCGGELSHKQSRDAKRKNKIVIVIFSLLSVVCGFLPLNMYISIIGIVSGLIALILLSVCIKKYLLENYKVFLILSISGIFVNILWLSYGLIV